MYEEKEVNICFEGGTVRIRFAALDKEEEKRRMAEISTCVRALFSEKEEHFSEGSKT